MAGREVDYLLVGGGLASANCARWLRESGADGSIVLVGRELDLPYNRPPLSKGYLQGNESKEDALFRPADWYEEQRIEALTRTSAMKLDLSARTVKLSNKEELGFGQLLLATGANVRRLQAPGAELEGIHYLRTFGNTDAIRGRCGRQTGGDDRRLLHRLRGGGVAEHPRELLLDPDDGGGHAQPPLRYKRRTVLSEPPRGARGGGLRR